MIDALAHLELFASADAARADARAAAEAGVEGLISAGVDPRLPEQVPSSTPLQVWRARGIHPSVVQGEQLLAQLRALQDALQDADVVALGECGLDRRPGMPDLALQRRAFAAQLDMARERSLPVLLHAVRADADVLAVLSSTGRGVVVVWHGFTGSLETLRRARALGVHISVGARVLDVRARRLREAVRAGGDFLLETDAPHTPLSSLPRVAAAVAQLQQRDTQEVMRAATLLTRQTFALGPP